MNKRTLALILVTALVWVAPAAAQTPDAAAAPSLLRKLDRLKGTWVGEAKGIGPGGKPYAVRQTERVGSMLDGDVLVIEGRGYEADGKLAFNAFGVVSLDAKKQDLEFRAYSAGRSGTYRMQATETGAIWEIALGPQAMMRYTITITDDQWHEVGEYLAKDQPARQTVEMKLRRTGDTDWPAAQPVR